MTAQSKLLQSKLFWVAVLYFSQGFPFGVFAELFPVWFRQQGVELKSIGAISLINLAWTVKLFWAPAVDRCRGHRWWMAGADVAMGAVLLWLACAAGLGTGVWVAIALFALLSATNDIAIDAYTIELLDARDLGMGNGIRIGLYRAGLFASGALLVLSDWIHWSGAFACGAVILAACALGAVCIPAVERPAGAAPFAAGQGAGRLVWLGLSFVLLLGVLVAIPYAWAPRDLLQRVPEGQRLFLGIAAGVAAAAIGSGVAALALWLLRGDGDRPAPARERSAPVGADPRRGALALWPVLAFVLIFKLGDASMGFMVKPFWVDAGFTATEIGLVSVNIGIGLSIAGGILGGWYTDRAGIFRSLWVLGLFQALSNLGYALAASLVPYGAGSEPQLWHRALIYGASAAESFTGGLGTSAFLAFLMAIVQKRHAATEYALLSSLFAASRSVAGWAGGFGAQAMGYGPYFFLTFFLSFPAYVLLPWVRRALERGGRSRRASPGRQ